MQKIQKRFFLCFRNKTFTPQENHDIKPKSFNLDTKTHRKYARTPKTSRALMRMGTEKKF